MTTRIFRSEPEKSKSVLSGDRKQIEAFFSLAFKNVTQPGFVQLRCFQQHPQKPVLAQSVKVDGKWYSVWPAVEVSDVDRLIDTATTLATRTAALRPVAVFSPPVCTLSNPVFAHGTDLVEGLCIRVECDMAPAAAHEVLTGILGQTTLTVLSGGLWRAPDGHIEEKCHLYWRLRIPTRWQSEHDDLRECCRLACLIAGADTSAIAAVHPLRWPGSWHLKAEPRLAQISEIEDRDVDLATCLAALEKAADAMGLLAPPPPVTNGEALPPDMAMIAAACDVINNNFEYDEWVKLGMSIYAGTNGTGFDLFDQISRQSGKYHSGVTRTRWNSFCENGRTTVATLLWHADQANPGWRAAYYQEQRAHNEAINNERWRENVEETDAMFAALRRS